MKTSSLRILIVLASLALSIPVFGQKHQVSGQVLDADTGEPVIGAGVMLSSGGGVSTDYDGKYVLMADADDVLTFTSIGYTDVQETVGGRTVINVSLSQDNTVLEEVVVLGYTTQKKAELSSSVVSMSGDKLRDVSTPDVGNMLQGKVAGVVVMNGSGRPGESADIRIRGTGSITAGAGPLYVVDGVAGGSFNPNDIETITVLKYASATALYGAAASGGVIVVTTKSGNQDKTEVEFKVTAGIKRALMGRFKPMNSAELYEFTRTMTKPNDFTANYPETLLEQDFDWLGNSFKTGQTQDYYASVSGKSGKVNYFLSADHYNELGTAINTKFRKTSARMNLSAPITDCLTLTLRLNYAKSYDRTESSWRLLEYAYYAMPWDIPYVMDENGNYTDEYVFMQNNVRPDNGQKWWTQNPSNIFHNEKYNYGKGWGDSLTGDLQLVWNVTDWLTLTSMNRYDTSNSFWETYTDPRTYEGQSTNGALANSEGEWSGWGTTNLAKMHKSFGDHDFNATLGWEFGEGYSRSLGASGTSIMQGKRALNNLDTPNAPEGYDYQTRSWALLGQVQYSYLGKYVATASIRYDESSKFGPKNRGGYFPGASAAWLISREPFLEGNKTLSFLKVRAGYGKTGNDNIPNFQYQETYSPSESGDGAYTLDRMANPYLGWEEALMASFGIDATIKNNWNVTVDLYHTINSRILLQAPRDPSSGFFAVMDNVGKVRNMGVELAVDGAIINKKDMSWTVGFNIGMNKNRVLELPDGEDIVMNRGEVNQILREGEDVFTWYMPKWLGVDSETGLPMWERVLSHDDLYGATAKYDPNEYSEGDVVTVNKWEDATNQLVGVASPTFSGGLNMAFRWKNITLSANGNFVVGNKIYNKTRESMDHDGAFIGMNLMSIDNGLGWSRWEQPGDNATHPQPSSGRKDGSGNTSSRFLEDGSFFRLRNVTLSYNLPQTWLKKVHMADARIFASADNIWTLSKFSGMDPEVRLDGDTYHHAGMYTQNYPIPMTVVFGIDVKF
ncbi:MAG: SusC/RagA family TonB-linked outer membrane protein [Bacteroidota bacterium]|nr:SusC/RagA family TonB-linked outer membrane protein [Bacteroidota bacterium]